MTTTDTASKDMVQSSGSQVRLKSDQEWTFQEYGDRLFSIGGSLFGPRSKMFNLSVSAMCVDILSQDVSKPTFHLWRELPGGGKQKVKPSEHPAARVIERAPNPYQGPKEFIRQLAANLAISNEYFVAARRNRQNDLLEIAGIQKQNVTPLVNPEARKWVYQISPSTLHEQALFGWASGEQLARNVAHIRARSLNGFDVISTAKVSASTLGILADMQKFQGNTYSSGGVPQLAFSFPDRLSDEQFERLERGIKRALKRSRETGLPIVLEGNGEELPKVEKLSQSAGDTEFESSKADAGIDICRYFRVPPHKAYLLRNVKYDNQAEQERIYVFDTLCSYFDMIEEAMNRVCLTENERDELFFGFDREKAYAMAPETHQKIVESRWKSGMLRQNEMREAIGKNPLPGDQGDHRLINGVFVMLDGDGEVVMQAGGNPPSDESSPMDDDDKKKPKKGGLELVHSA